MTHRALALLAALAAWPLLTTAQKPAQDALSVARAELARQGISARQTGDLRLADSYTDALSGVQHTWFRQQWQGLDVWKSEVALHQRADGSVITLVHRTADISRQAPLNAQPALSAADALDLVLRHDGVPTGRPAQVGQDPVAHRWRFDGSAFSGEEPFVQLVWYMAGEDLVLAWNVNYYTPNGSHWWNVRLDANTGRPFDRNDWVAQCGFDEMPPACGAAAEAMAPAPMPAVPNDYNVFPPPVESPNFGSRAIRNAPWSLAPNASPYGWHDTNGASGAEYTITRGNNVWAQEDANGNNGTGYSPSSATLNFDFPLDLSQAPSAYQDAAITNLFFWNNYVHDVTYQYGFDEVSGNFQSNNYGHGGAGNDYVLADAQDGSGTNNANFGTPADGANPRMQMYLWTTATPNRDGDLDDGIIAHEYGHGVSNRLIGGPSNVDCLDNAEQMGEGWSDFLALVLTMKSGDHGTDARGMGTYAIAEPPNGIGIRPSPYSTNMGVNPYTYANTNDAALSEPHGIGFVWCTMLWDMTWALVDQYGFDPDVYHGTGGNNRALRLVLDGLKLTACSPGFVDGRNAILQADVADYGGADVDLLWTVFARRGLGFSASQGSTNSTSDQVEAFDLPVNNSIGVIAALFPTSAGVNDCSAGNAVQMTVRNTGQLAQSNFPVSYRVDGGTPVTETFPGTLAPSATVTFTFATLLPTLAVGPHTMQLSSGLVGDQNTTDDNVTFAFDRIGPSTVPYLQDLESAAQVPTGWALQNPDNSFTWQNTTVANGPLCASTHAWTIDFYDYNGAGQQDRLISPVLDLAGSAGCHLHFHHAYVPYNSTYVDSLRLQISTDCGANWTTLYQAGGNALATASASTSSWVPSNCSQWLLHDMDLSAYDGRRIQLRFTGICGFGNNLYLDNVELVQNGVRLAVSLFLEGPYDSGTGLMRDDLRVAGVIPGTEPYTGLGFTQAADGGGEAVQTGVLNATGNNAIVDWVLVELRNTSNPSTIVATRPALVQRDGDVVAEDGVSPIALLAPAGNYYVAVRHRNHLGAMTASAVALTGTSTAVDLRTPATATYGTQARKTIGSVQALWAGNVLRSPPSQLQYTGTGNDRDPILVVVGGTTPNNSVAGYRAEDVTMNGITQYTGVGNDRDPILVNVGSTTPNSVRTEQLP